MDIPVNDGRVPAGPKVPIGGDAYDPGGGLAGQATVNP